MSYYFANVDNNFIIRDIVVVDEESCKNKSFPESEIEGKKFLEDLNIPGNFYQFSQDGSFRGIVPRIGDKFDPSIGDHGEFSYILEYENVGEVPQFAIDNS